MPDLAQTYLVQARTMRSEHWSGPPKMVDRLIRTMGTGPGDVVVDLGCGIGGPARRLAELVGCRVVGVDLLPPILRIGSRRRRPGVAYVAGDICAVPLRDGIADQAWMLGSAAHAVDVRAMMSEVRRVLRPGGRLGMTEMFWEGRGLPHFVDVAPLPWQPLTVSGFMSVAEGAGLTEISALPWPGRGLGRESFPSDPVLARDLREGRLIPALVVATSP